MSKKPKLSKTSWHEALDRAHLLSLMFDEFLTEHPAIRLTPKLNKEAAAISFALGELYQAIGVKRFEK